MRLRRKPAAAIAAAVFVALFAFGCSSAKKSRRSSAPSSAGERNDSKGESAAERAVEKTEEDERMAPLIQKEINALFFREKELNPGGLDAFSQDRIQVLEIELPQSANAAIKYYIENRAYFDRVEDAGGGFRVTANAKRLVPVRWTKAGRKKLFAMDTARVREMIANPCFTAIQDCGEYASDGEENTVLLQEWVGKYSEPEYRLPRERVLRNYLAVLEKYRNRMAKGGRPVGAKSRQATLLIGTHIRGVQSLLRE